MMKAAQQMMQDPSFQANMKKMAETSQFQQSIKRTKDVMNDPKKMEEMQKKMESKLEEGTKQLEELEKKEAALKEKGEGEEADDEKKPAAK